MWTCHPLVPSKLSPEKPFQMTESYTIAQNTPISLCPYWSQVILCCLHLLPFQTTSLGALPLSKILQSSLGEIMVSREQGQGGALGASTVRFTMSSGARGWFCPAANWWRLKDSPQALNPKPFFLGVSFCKQYLLTADQLEDHEAKNCNDMRLYSSTKGSKWNFKVHKSTNTMNFIKKIHTQ